MTVNSNHYVLVKLLCKLCEQDMPFWEFNTIAAYIIKTGWVGKGREGQDLELKPKLAPSWIGKRQSNLLFIISMLTTPGYSDLILTHNVIWAIINSE